MSPESAHLATYRINLPAFSGPLELLLHLIDHNELDITALSLANVTEQYLEQVKILKEDRAESLMDFLSVGARLLVIKSRALLPQYVDESLSDTDEEDPGEALARQLREYQRFRRLGDWLQRKEDSGSRTFLRVSPAQTRPNRPDLSDVSIQTLITAIREMRDRQHMMEDSISVATDKIRFSIERQIKLLRRRLSTNRTLFFDDLLSSNSPWTEVSTTLLAVLELIKRHELNAFQSILFGPIELVAQPGPLVEPPHGSPPDSLNG